MSLDETLLDKMLLDRMLLDKMLLDEATLDETSLDEPAWYRIHICNSGQTGSIFAATTNRLQIQRWPQSG
jgi:hypothetical protein